MARDGVELVRGASPLTEALAEAAGGALPAGYHPRGAAGKCGGSGRRCALCGAAGGRAAAYLIGATAPPGREVARLLVLISEESAKPFTPPQILYLRSL